MLVQKIIESLYWLKIFLSPVFACILLIGILSSVFEFSWYFVLLLIPGCIVGIMIAERVRRKNAPSVFYAKTMNTPDITETWEKEPKEKKN